MLPNEAFLHVLHCADYKSLVLAKLAGLRLLRLITKYAAELAFRRRFVVLIYDFHLIYYEMTNTVPHSKMISYEPGSQQSLAAACREVADVIGPHIIFQSVFDGRQWNMPGVDAIFEAAPPLKYAEYVQLICLLNSTISDSCDAFMSNFAAMKELRVWFDYEVFRQFDWTFVGRESARELRLVKFTRAPFWQGNANGLVEGLVHYCITRLPRLRGGEPLELDFSGISFPAAFGLRVIKLLKGSGSELTFRMKTLRNGELVLDESEYSVDADGTTKRYASDESGIVVEAQGDSVTIRSTAEDPRKKPRTS